jgi:spore coat protein A
MYHCHILEHEDRDMMRPFVVVPAKLKPIMDP